MEISQDTDKDNCTFIQAGAIKTNGPGHTHNHGENGHSHEHGHTHEVLDSPGKYTTRDRPVFRSDWKQRAYTVGIGGPVGSGKTALVLALCKHLRDSHNVCVVTNDIFTREDWEFLVRNKALPEERMRAVETGGCPHAAIREDFSLNLEEVKELTQEFHPDLVIIESGGDNLAANFSRELADYIIYVIDVAGGDKVPRKGGPGITQSDMLVINKTDLAEAVGADLKKFVLANSVDPDETSPVDAMHKWVKSVMDRDAKLMRQDGPTIFAQAKHMVSIPEIASLILEARQEATQNSA